MNVLYIWDADYPWDVRVEKICNSLLKNGNKVHIAARNLKKSLEYEVVDDINIHRIKAWKNDRINYALSFPAFFSPIWKKFLDEIIIKCEINLIIVRDLPMAIAGIWAGKRNRIPVIFDMAEDYVAMIWDIWRKRKFKGFNLVVRNPYLAKYVEKYVFKNSDHILVVVEEAMNVIIKGGGDVEKATIVGNTPLIESFNDNETQLNDDLKRIKEHFSAIYTGGIQMGRGIQTVLDAIPEIVKKIPDFLFVVVGDGYATDQLKEFIKEKCLQDYVLWVGWVVHSQLHDFIKLSNIGLIPHFATDHTNTTIPNKIFDYMGCGLPVISTDAVPLERIMNDEKCGITFKSGNAEDLTMAILDIYNSTIEYGINGIEAVKYRFNWKEDEKRLFRVVKHLVNDLS